MSPNFSIDGLELREISADELVQINKWRNDQEVISHLGNGFRYINVEVDNIWFEEYLRTRDKNVRLSIYIDEVHVGLIQLLGIDQINRSCEFSIQISNKDFRGRGIGLLASRMLLSHFFNDLNLNRIWLTVRASNSRGLSLYSKLGFLVEGRLREAIVKNGEYVDLILMSITRRDFSSKE